MIFAIIGASGAGKNSVCGRVFKKLNIEKAKSWITRDKRKEEKGDEYYFLDKCNKDIIKSSATYDKHRGYKVGTYLSEFKNSDVYTYQSRQGVEQLINKFGKENVIVIFIYATPKECKNRLHRLGKEEMNKRLKFNNTSNEYCPEDNVDYIIRNKQGYIMKARKNLEYIINNERS